MYTIFNIFEHIIIFIVIIITIIIIIAICESPKSESFHLRQCSSHPGQDGQASYIEHD